MNSRKAVTLRFKDNDLKIIQQIVRKEFGPGVSLEVGIKAIVINITQAYLNNLAEELKRVKEEEANKDGQSTADDSSGDSSSVQVQDGSSPVLADSGNDSVSE